MNSTKNKNAFTLIELLVILAILSILMLIGFITYTSYTIKVRDTNRIAQVINVGKGLEVYKVKKGLPLPDDHIEVYSSGELIAYQGYAGKNTLESIDYSNDGLDPNEKTYISYYVTKSRKYFELLTLLEQEPEHTLNPLTQKTHAEKKGSFNPLDEDFSNRYPYVYGSKLGILTNDQNTPLQGISSILATNSFDINSATGYYIAHFKQDGSLLGTGDDLAIIADLAKNGGKPNSCLAWVIMNPDLVGNNGIYQLTDETGQSYEGFCDWTPPENIEEYAAVYSSGMIDYGSFEGGLWPEPGETGAKASGNNKRKKIDNPTGEEYVLYQGASWQSSYDITMKPEHLSALQKDDIVRMTAWVADLNEDGYIFHNIISYSDSTTSINGEVHTIETQTIDGREWKLQYVDHLVEKDPSDFIWHLGYNAETSPKKFYATGLQMEIRRAQ